MNQLNTLSKINFPILTLFAISMGFLEAIVVVYVRELYYPEGFDFPLIMLPSWLVGIEIIRELCTLLMLGSVAWISGKSFLQRLSVFLFSFGIWDIFYYVALKIFLDWPESLFTWDILFLIPITWIGPVLAPVICSIVMIMMCFMFEYFRIKNNVVNIKPGELWMLISGAAVIYISFTYDFGKIILNGKYLDSFFTLQENQKFLNEMAVFMPIRFQWEIFIVGILIITAGNFFFVKRAVKIKN